ncbi:hypothetical protein E2C01_048204 [Portunus trituberculatus]|uniref:Uncharacterized protein n=1 Tax=Portunus trituberculatus TaxID=210409 RepID=A0A5B7GAJ1_PORTR|nr:hypothetical protein [Portunus trituberculatus]
MSRCWTEQPMKNYKIIVTCPGFSLLWFLDTNFKGSQLGTSGAMQKPGQAGPASVAGPEVKVVPASAMGPTTTGGFHARFLGQDMEVSICHTTPKPGSQTPIWDIDGGICHMAPMPGGQPLIPSHGFIHGS